MHSLYVETHSALEENVVGKGCGGVYSLNTEEMKRNTMMTRDIIENNENNLRWENQGNETNRNYFLFLGGWNFHFGDSSRRLWPVHGLA
jgi:hypothetical protein